MLIHSGNYTLDIRVHEQEGVVDMKKESKETLVYFIIILDTEGEITILIS